MRPLAAKIILVMGAAFAALFISGCASDQAYLKAQADAAVANGQARVAEAHAEAERARAVIALASKIDAGGASAYLTATALKGLTAPREAPVQVARPRDFLDYLSAFTNAVGVLGNVAIPIVTVKEAGKTSRAGFERDLGVERARQVGESHRIDSVAGIASAVAAAAPTVNNSYTLSGTGVIGDGTYAVTTTTNRNCNGGQAAPGGNGGQGTTAGGSGASGGSAPGGSC
jgi:hypothetical protein